MSSTSTNKCHVSLARERKKEGFQFKKSMEAISHFGHNKRRVTHNKLKFQGKVHSDEEHIIDCDGHVPSMAFKPQNWSISDF